jgi:hypothetical protein
MPEKMNQNVVDAILDLKDRDPFVPFKVVLASGDKYLIERGANLVEMRTEFFYASPKKDGFVFIRKTQIAAVEGSQDKVARKRAS